MALRADALATLLQGGSLSVSDGSQTAVAQLDDGFPVVRDGVVVLQATFSEQEANFEWASRAVRTVAGVELDVEPQDLGRKAPGAVWTLAVELAEAS